MRRRIFFALCVFFVLPAGVQAASFAKQSLFLSRSSVTEGDTVLIHAVVSNDSLQKFTGTLTLTSNAETIGTVPVILGAGEADTVSLSWKPVAGTPEVTAVLKDKSGAVVEQEAASFTIDAKPVPKKITLDLPTDSVDSSIAIQKAIGNLSPLVADTSKPVFTTIDNGRRGAANALDSGIAWSKKQLGQNLGGSVLGTSKDNSASAGKKVGTTLWTILATLALYLFSVLRYVVGHAGVFYPVAVLLFFYILWRGYKSTRRPRW